MAKIRTLKGEFFRNARISRGGLQAKVLGAGLITAVADDDGRFKADAEDIRGEVFTHDSVSVEDVEKGLLQLKEVDFIQLYQAHGRRFGAIKNWKDHQPVPPSRYVASKLPAPPNTKGRRHRASSPQAPEDDAQAVAASRAGVGSEGNRKGEERNGINASPTPSANEPVIRLAVGMQDVFGRGLSTHEQIACQAALNQYAYMDAEALLQRAREHIAHCQSQVPPLPTPRTVAGFSETWRSQNDWLADHGAQKAWRPSRLPAGLTRVGDMLPATAVQRDPDE